MNEPEQDDKCSLKEELVFVQSFVDLRSYAVTEKEAAHIYIDAIL